MNNLAEEKRYTYADYITWGDDIRYELIDGIPYAMASPSRAHQKISVELSGRLWQFLRGKPCEVYHAPFDVRVNYRPPVEAAACNCPAVRTAQASRV